MQPNLSLAAIRLVLSGVAFLRSVKSRVNLRKLLDLVYPVWQIAQYSLSLLIWCINDSPIHCKSLSYCIIKCMLVRCFDA